ncbi:copper homeostasis protein CutC [Psychroserpens burtonensis]|uniref:PF03932 family protein CutC n=1 Tax=Psychroserpens burtonensis TaxID=49278 RepID=A0A5C7B8C0_9FLAO|nr:copper homeostasis protein CutC [Psychroserpens burtonensis]TXE17438.1 copper homeostasis protein CutC [Psychroserpens burtonensis]
MTLEICTNSYQSAKNAQISGAKRIELCSELSIGGITPSYGLIQQVIEELDIETFVLIRPRSGNFQYSEAEFDIIKKDIQICKDLGCHGIVSGVLNDDNTIDIKRTQDLIALSKPLPFTFHRAFDIVPNPEKALEQLIKLGVHRILTSGQHPKAIDGLDNLKALKEQAKNRITLLVGSGINSQNAKLFKDAGFEELHASASEVIHTVSSVYFGNTPQTVSSITEIKAILKTIDNEV